MSKDLLQKVIDNVVKDNLTAFFQGVSNNYSELEDDLSEYDEAERFTNFQAIGEFEFSPIEKLVVVTADGVGDLTERSGKKAQYEKAKKILKSFKRYDAGLFVFRDPSGNFRLSLVYGTPDSTRLVWSNFHRFTYFVSPDEPYRTVLERIGNCDFSSLGNIKEAFSVEKVTKDFYTEYDRIFKDVEQLIYGFGDSKEETEKKRLFTQTLFNRLMFIAFIEKKGWLKYNSKTDYLYSFWKDYENNSSAKTNFYHDRLKALFFSALNTTNNIDTINANKNSAVLSLIGDVPYLNGGLFEENDKDCDFNIVIPDQCFKSIIEELFKRFNFTVTENTPLDVEVAVDPEMLGKVFEELVTGRHETGSYYTPKTVVSFMCREALKGYLGGYEKLIDYDDVSKINVTEARELISKLRCVTICDPACGSGAYLVGMLHELQGLHRLLDTRAAEMTARDDYQLKLEIIQNNLYGVDIDSFAVNIARLRLWLSLAIEYDGDKPEPLPNLDFKIEIGDSLISPDPQAGLEQGFRAELIRQFKEKKDGYISIHKPVSKNALREEILELRKQIMEWTYPGKKFTTFDWAVDFIEVFSNGGFNIVISNPPYGLSCEDPLRFQYFPRKKGEDPQSKDSYGLFVARALQLLRPQGFFTFIISDTWRTIKSHRPLRSKLLRETTVIHVIDLPSWIFQATVNTCILTLRKQQPGNEHSLIAVDLHNLPNNDWQILEANFYATATHIPDVQTTTYARYTYHQILISSYDNLSFFIGSVSLYKLMSYESLTKLWKVADIKQGLATGDNEYYLRKREGARGNYKILDDNELLKEEEICSLTDKEKTSGVNPFKYNGRHFMPYDKGGESDSEVGWLPNYNVPTQYFIDWSRDSVNRLHTATVADVKRRKGQADKIEPTDETHIASRFQNSEYYFRNGITFSPTGFYAPTYRLLFPAPFDKEGSGIFSMSIKPIVLLGILCSTLSRYLSKQFINHTVHAMQGDVAEIPIVTLEEASSGEIEKRVGEIVEKQNNESRYPYYLKDQKEIDHLIYSLYRLTADDMREVELWYCRRYPKLAKTQGVLEEVGNRYSNYLKRCELILSKHPDYWKLHPILQLISQCEGQNLEFKGSLEADLNTGQKNQGVLHASLKTIAAFLNTSGGTLLIGVSDNGDIRGLEKDYNLCNKRDKDGLEQKIRSYLKSYFQPDPIGKIEINFVCLPEGDICRIDVQSSKDVFYLDGKDVYARDGNTCRKLEGPILVNWIQKRATQISPSYL